MYKKLCLLLLFIPALLVAEVRLAIDVGSEAVKYKIANKGRTLAQEEYPLLLRQALERSGTEIIPDQAEAELVEILQEISTRAQELHVKRYACVATEVMRQAHNGKQVRERVERATGLEMMIITRREEGTLGFVGTAAHTNFAEDRLVVWDVGGGSMEISTQSETYPSGLGSEDFRREVVHGIKRENAQAVLTANPMSREQIEQALDLAAKYAPKIPAGMQKAMVCECLVGIGALGFLDVPESGPTYSLSELKAALLMKVNRTDEELGGGPYVGAVVTNLCLAVGFMRTLRIETLHTADVDLADGLLLVGAYQREFQPSSIASRKATTRG